MVEEVRGLLDRGVSEEFLLKLGLEYRFITQYLTGRIATLEEMRDLLSTAIKQFAKRQMTWFRRDQAIHWLDMTPIPPPRHAPLSTAFLTGKTQAKQRFKGIPKKSPKNREKIVMRAGKQEGYAETNERGVSWTFAVCP